MTQLLFANNATTTLFDPITSGATTANLSPGTGALFPALGSGQQFIGTLVDAATGLVTEIVHVTARSGDTITIVRGQEGTTAHAWLAGDTFANYPTAGTAAAFDQIGLNDGFNIQVFATPGTFSWTAPVGVTRVKAVVVGGGSSGACGTTVTAAAGGSAGGAAIGFYAVTPGTAYAVVVGAGGAAQVTNGTAGSAGGTSSFASFCSATGGQQQVALQAGPPSGMGSGGQINLGGGTGGDAILGNTLGGAGGNSLFGGGGRMGTAAGVAGQAYGAGGGGSYGVATPGPSGAGAAGVVILTW